MKVNKEIRWLVFLLTPFLIMLTLLFIVPVEFLLNSYQLQDASFLEQKLSSQQNLIRSQTFLSSEVLQKRMDSFTSEFYWLTNFMQNPSSKFETFLPQSAQINNLFEFYQSNLNKSPSKIVPVSMWFATNITNSSFLSANQKQLYNAYLRTEPFIRAHFSADNPDGYTSISMCLNNTDTIYFEYPTHLNQEFTALNSSTIASYCNKTLTNYAISNKSQPFYQLINGLNAMKYCTIVNSLSLSGVICLGIETQAFVNDLNSPINETGIYTANNFYLISPVYDSKKPSLDIFLTSPSGLTSTNLLPYALNSTNALSPAYNSNSNKLMTTYQNGAVLYVLPILVEFSLQQFTPVAYLLVESLVIASNLDASKSTQDILNYLLVPIILIPILTIVLSLFFLKKTLHQMEKQLENLNDRCKFIVQGDIQIEIPEYIGNIDFQKIYKKVRIINKLHKYTSPDYFKGHFANKILKYNEALFVFQSLGYDRGYLLENIGQCYLNIEEFQKSINSLKESVDISLKNIETKFGGLDLVYQNKIQKKKIFSKYKVEELVLIRRLFKLNMTLFKALDLQFISKKKVDDEIENEQEKVKKRLELLEVMHEALDQIKKAFHPDYSKYSESVITWGFQVKFYINIKNFDKANQHLEKAYKIHKTYLSQYEEINKKINNQDKQLIKKRKITAHSRTNPAILQAMLSSFNNMVILNEPRSYKQYYEGFCILIKGVQGDIMTQSMQYLTVNEMYKTIKETGIGLRKFQSTQLFRQSMPLKILYHGDPQQANDPELIKFCSLSTPGLQREFIFLFDSSKIYLSQQLKLEQQEYLKEKYTQIFEKFIKNTDRISIVRCDTEVILESPCNLTLKESNQNILKNQLISTAIKKSKKGKNNLLEGISKIINRIKSLLSEKIVFINLKHLDCYYKQFSKKIKRANTKYDLDSPSSPIKSNQLIGPQSPLQNKRLKEVKSKIKSKKSVGAIEEVDIGIQTQKIEAELLKFGDQLIEILAGKGLRNCKLIFNCALNDDLKRIKKTLGLVDINKRLWKRLDESGLNIHNNVVFIADSKHKKDVSRILMYKFASPPDNNVFIL